MFDGMFDDRIATSSNIIDKIRKLQSLELADSDDEKPTRGPTRSWIKRRKENGFFETIIKELILEDLAGFKEMFRMGYADFEKILSSIVVLISPQEIIGGHRPILEGLSPVSAIFKDKSIFYSVFETKTFEL